MGIEPRAVLWNLLFDSAWEIIVHSLERTSIPRFNTFITYWVIGKGSPGMQSKPNAFICVSIYGIYVIKMTYEETILIKLDKDTKRKMKEIDANWSELIREFIQNELNRKRNTARAEKLRARLFRHVSGMNSTQIIRKFRDERYGPNSP